MGEAFLLGLVIYFAIGGIIGLLFITFLVGRADAAAKGSGLLFRLTILPGAIALWPIILVRILSFYQVNKNPHSGEGA